MLVIIAVVAASATLQASGGLDVMLQIAEKLLRRNEICFYRGAFRHLHADHPLRYRPRGVYHPADYLRCGD